MRRLTVVCVVLVVSLVVPALAGSGSAVAATTYTCAQTSYVDPAGNDANSGQTSSAAWRTLARVSAATLPAGTCVRLKSGAVFTGTLSLAADDVNDRTRPVVVTTSGADKAWISSGTSAGVTISNTGGVIVDNLGIYGSGYSKNKTDGIAIRTDQPGGIHYPGITVQGVDVSGYGGSGISIAGAPKDGSKSGFSDVTIASTLAHDNGDAGIQSYGNSPSSPGFAHANVLIDHVKVYGNVGISTKGANSGSGIVLGNVDGATVQYSVAYANGARNGYAAAGPVGIWAWDANNVVIAHNESYGNSSGTAADGDGFDLDGGVTNSVMEYNYSHDNAGAGFLVYQYNGARTQSGNVVRYNISQNDARRSTHGALNAGASTGAVTGTVDFYGNTVYVSPAGTAKPAGIRAWSGTASARFFNNIVYATQGVPLVSVEKGAAATFQGNDWWTAGSAFAVYVGGSNYSDTQATKYSSLTAWSTATGAESASGHLVGKSVDPLLTAPGQGPTIGNADALGGLTSYLLKAGSPVADAGMDLSVVGVSNGGADFYGHVAPNGGYAIGADEP
jgi:hypothetical protein